MQRWRTPVSLVCSMTSPIRGLQRPALQASWPAHEPQVFHRGLVQIEGWLFGSR